MIGTFLKGVVVGVIGLGVLSWLVAEYLPENSNETSGEDQS